MGRRKPPFLFDKQKARMSLGFHFFKRDQYTIDQMFEIARNTEERMEINKKLARKKAVKTMQDRFNNR